MKIAVNGNIIDTELIYQITPVETVIDGWSIQSKHFFTIKIFNGGEIVVNKQIIDANITDITKLTRQYLEIYDITHRRNFIKNLPSFNTSLEEITQFRDSIVNIWSNNRGDIPTFDIK